MDSHMARTSSRMRTPHKLAFGCIKQYDLNAIYIAGPGHAARQHSPMHATTA